MHQCYVSVRLVFLPPNKQKKHFNAVSLFENHPVKKGHAHVMLFVINSTHMVQSKS